MSWFNPLEWFAKTISSMWHGIQNMPNPVVSGIGQLVGHVTAPISSAAQQIQNWILGGIQSFADFIGGTIRSITDGIGQGLAWLGTSLMNALQSVGSIIISGLTGGAQWFWSNLVNAARGAGQWIVDQLRDLGSMAGEAINALLEGVFWLPKTVMSGLQDTLSKAADFLWRSIVEIVLANLPSAIAVFYLGQSMKHVHRYSTSLRKMFAFALSPLFVYIAANLALGIANLLPRPPSTPSEYKKAIEAPKAYATTSRTLTVPISVRYTVTLTREFEVPVQTVGKARLSGFEAKAPSVSYTVALTSYSGTYTRGAMIATSANRTEQSFAVELVGMTMVGASANRTEQAAAVELATGTLVQASTTITEQAAEVMLTTPVTVQREETIYVSPMRGEVVMASGRFDVHSKPIDGVEFLLPS